jgi:hypothetical protein
MSADIDIDRDTAALEAYALKHYEDGGHWVYETHGREDYEQYLAEANWDLNVAIQRMVSYWQLMNMQRKECAWE